MSLTSCDGAVVVEQVLQVGVLELRLAVDLGLEVDVRQYPAQRLVLGLQCRQCLVEHLADIGLQIFHRRLPDPVFIRERLGPAGAGRHKERLAIGGAVFQQFLHLFGAGGDEYCARMFCACLVEDIGHALEEEQAEDVFLVFGGVHLAAQHIGGLHQKAFELRQRDLAARHVVTIFEDISLQVPPGSSKSRLSLLILADRSEDFSRPSDSLTFDALARRD